MSLKLIQPVYAADCAPDAEGKIKLSECLTLKDGRKVANVYNNPSVLVNLLVSNLFVFAGIIIFILIIAAGFKFIMGDSKGKEESKGIITAVVGGFILMFVAYWIVKIVAVITGAQINI